VTNRMPRTKIANKQIQIEEEDIITSRKEKKKASHLTFSSTRYSLTFRKIELSLLLLFVAEAPFLSSIVNTCFIL
jgi:hypothetical protein